MSGIISLGAGAPSLDIGVILGVPEMTPKYPPGAIVTANDPSLGCGMFMYGQCDPAGTTLGLGTACTFSPINTAVKPFNNQVLMQALPNVGNQGVPVYFARQAFTLQGQWGWFQFSGLCPCFSSGTITPGVGVKIGINAAGRLGAVSNGKQILGIQVVAPDTTSFTKSGVGITNGSKVVTLPNLDDLFPGIMINGSGLPGFPLNSFINSTTAVMGVAATATATITATFSYTGFTLCRLNSPSVQSQIT